MNRFRGYGGLLMGGLCHGVLTAAEPPTVTYHEEVAPVILKHCAPCHHPGGSAPFSLLTYAEVAKRASDVVDVAARGYMPPWLPAPGPHRFADERRMTSDERSLLRRWADQGAVEGDAAKSPPIPPFSSEWKMGPPDLVVKLPEAYVVPAEGKDVYRNFVLPLNLDRRRYVKGWELRPHSRAAHHAFVRVDRSGEGRRRDGADAETGFPGMDLPSVIQAPSGHFASWQPGAAPQRNPPGLAWTLEPGTDLVLQVHLQPIGRPEPFQPELGLYFTDQPPTNQPVKLGLGSFAIQIPAGSTNVVVRDEFVLPADADLLAVLPHTHYLGRRIEGRAVFPDGREEQLLLIPEWDFNWQGAYRYQTPVFLPVGTKVTMSLQFDNSTSNVRNPFSPPRTVQYGPNTTDEMAELWLQLLPRDAQGSARLEQALLQRIARDTVAYNEQRLRMDPLDGMAMVNIGRARLAQRRFAEAEALFRQAVRVRPGLDEAHYYVGLMLRMKDRANEAAAEFRKVLEINPDHARAHGNLGFLELEAGRTDAASAHLEKAVQLDPQDALALGALGSIRKDQGRRDEAAALYRRVLALDPQNEEAREGLKQLGASTAR